VLNDEKYQLPVNNGPNSLQGGFIGFDMVVWNAKQIDNNKVESSYFLKGGAEGYPGN
jgi:aldose 1-epimerase